MTRARLILAGILVVVATIFWWLFTHARVRIVVDNASGNDTISYRLLQAGGEPEGKLANSVTKLVRRGDYGVVVQQGSKSYFASVSVGGFLGTTTVKAHLEEESARSFIGNQPGECAYLVSDILFSGVCNDSLRELDRHAPASTSAPTHTERLTANTDDTLLSIVTIKNGSSYAVTQSTNGTSLSAAPITRDGSLGAPLALSDVSDGGNYAVHDYKDGFAVLDIINSKLFYVNPAEGTTKALALSKPSDQELAYQSMNVHGDTIAVVYSKGPVTGSPDVNPDKSEQASKNTDSSTKKSSSQVVLVNGSASKLFRFSFDPYRVKVCAENRLCVLEVGAKMQVYDVSGKKAKKLYSINNVADLEINASGLMLVTNTGLTSFDITKRTGHVAYSFGDYSFEGLAVDAHDYVVNVSDASGDSFALQIEPSKKNTDSIDKKVRQLATNSSIAKLSIYRQFIFVTPQLGSPEYDESVHSFNYTQSARNAASQSINEALQKLGLSNYTVVNTLK